MKNTWVKEHEPELMPDAELPQSGTPYRKWGRVGLAALCGFLFSQLDFNWQISPFSVSFVAALPFEYCFSAFVGSALGCFTNLGLGQAVRYTAAIFLTCLFRLIKGRYFSFVEDGYINGILALCSNLVTGLVHHFVTEGEFMGVFSVAIESAVAFGTAMLFIKSFKTPVVRIGIESLSVRDSLCLGSSLCIFLVCASGFTIEGLSPGRILAFLAILFVSVYKGVSGAAVVGICVGLSLGVNPDFRFLFASVAFGALASGVFSSLGQTASSVAFAVCASGVSAFGGDSGIVCVIEIVIASAVFIILPSKYIASVEEYLQKKGISGDGRINNEVSENLNAAAENIYDVSEIVCRVSEKLDSIINPEVNRLFSFLQQRVCDGCERKSTCWNKNFDSTASDVLSIAGIESGKRISLRKNCKRFEKLTQYILEGYSDYAESLSSKMKLSEMRKVLTDQFTGMGDFLKSTAIAVSESRVLDKAKSTAVKSALQDTGIYVDALSYYCNVGTKVTVEITVLDSELHEQHKKIKTILEFVTKRRFEKASITVTDFRTVIVFEEKTAFKVQTGYAQRPMKEGAVCGDSVIVTTQQTGNRAVVLSDGMGTGARAKIDSAMTCSIMEKLLSSGFSFDSALKIVNSSLIMKSTDESISTIDAVSINLYTGRAEFFKAGAAITFIRSGNEITVLEGASLPVGIIRNVEFFKSTKELLAGDIVLLLSDGAAGADCGWIHDELLAWSTNSMDDLACHIVKLAQLRSNEKTRDDITAVAVKISRNRE